MFNERTHYGPRADAPPRDPADHPWRSYHCYGQIQSLYTRRGSASRWVKIGRLCLKCSAFWPERAFWTAPDLQDYAREIKPRERWRLVDATEGSDG